MDKAERYTTTVKQVESIITSETDLTANLANTCAILRENHHFFWVGFYMHKNDELVLGPFQGPLACTRIAMGKGVCGTAAAKKETILVEDVHQFPGHIACSADSQSEIVVPLTSNGDIYGVLDVDSDQLADFDETDQHYLEEICKIITNHHFQN